MVRLDVVDLPDDPLAAAAAFHTDWLDRVRAVVDPPRNGEVAAGTADGGGSPPAASSPQAAPPLHHPADGRPPRAGEDLLLTFPAADHAHRAWRLAVVQGLARQAAPNRVNAVSGGDATAIESALAYLAAAPGLTGQYLPLDDAGAGAVV